MTTQKEIAQQQELLLTYRRRLAYDLQQRLRPGAVPASLADNIRKARDEIQRIKTVLREWGVNAEDLPNDVDNDDDALILKIPPGEPVPLSTLIDQFNSSSVHYPVPQRNQKPVVQQTTASQPVERNQVFISYSHSDKKWLDRLMVHLRPLIRDEKIKVWNDTRLAPGSNWRKEIDNALRAAKVAILLVSADFLASDFIATDELPPLLKAAQYQGAVILPVIISPSRFLQTRSLSQFQAVNAPNQPLVKMTIGKREEVLVKVTEAVESALHQKEQPTTKNFTPVSDLDMAQSRHTDNDHRPPLLTRPKQRSITRIIITIDTSPLMGNEKGEVLKFSYMANDTFMSLLNKTWAAISSKVPAWTYGVDWILRDSSTGHIFRYDAFEEVTFKNFSKYLRLIESITWKDVGILPGMTLEVILLNNLVDK